MLVVVTRSIFSFSSVMITFLHTNVKIQSIGSKVSFGKLIKFLLVTRDDDEKLKQTASV